MLGIAEGHDMTRNTNSIGAIKWFRNKLFGHLRLSIGALFLVVFGFILVSSYHSEKLTKLQSSSLSAQQPVKSFINSSVDKSVNQQSQTAGSDQSSSTNSTTQTVNINGQNISVPSNGTYKSATDSNGDQVSSTVTSSNNSSGSNNSSNLNVTVNSSSTD